MEPAMSANYAEINSRGQALLDLVKDAVGFRVEFKGAGVPEGTQLYVDTRANVWKLDGGKCTQPGELINFPAGELFTPPYEGVSPGGRELFGDSQTSGTWAVYSPKDEQVVLLKVEKNMIVEVPGDSEKAKEMRELISKNPLNANIAELAFGLNELARPFEHVSILEKEKAGPHIAYGRNDHFGTSKTMAGKVVADVHVDEVYTPITPVTVSIVAVYDDGRELLIAENGKVTAV
jgi:leucyl aminopeptidase (aminopeptidase T)